RAGRWLVVVSAPFRGALSILEGDCLDAPHARLRRSGARAGLGEDRLGRGHACASGAHAGRLQRVRRATAMTTGLGSSGSGRLLRITSLLRCSGCLLRGSGRLGSFGSSLLSSGGSFRLRERLRFALRLLLGLSLSRLALSFLFLPRLALSLLD